jgi:diacylglycerol kinase family enzyme
VVALARRAVNEGVDLLGVAGGDGTQALVAGIAAEHDLPFLVISAGTAITSRWISGSIGTIQQPASILSTMARNCGLTSA